MKNCQQKVLLTFIFCMIATRAFATTWVPYKVYADGDVVTHTNFNGNINSLGNILNGGLDNNNANTADGFRFIEILDSLPAAGNQGRVVFLTADNTLYFDTGSSFVKVATFTGTPAQGDLLYHNGSIFALLNKSTTATRYLANTGSNNNPAWDQVNISDGLKITSQATGDIIYASSSTVWQRLGIGSSKQSLRVSGGLPIWEIATNTEVFTSSGNFTAPAGVTRVYVTLIGGGGGGAGDAGTAGAGGGGGAGAERILVPYTVTPNSTYAVVVGAGGAASNNTGNNGSASTFDGTLSTPGGNGGVTDGGGGAGGTGGAATNGAGGAPTAGATIIPFSGGAGGARSGTNGGGGGASLMGAGGAGGTDNNDGSNAPTANSGAGGGGCGATSGTNGGAGASGIVIVTY